MKSIILSIAVIAATAAIAATTPNQNHNGANTPQNNATQVDTIAAIETGPAVNQIAAINWSTNPQQQDIGATVNNNPHPANTAINANVNGQNTNEIATNGTAPNTTTNSNHQPNVANNTGPNNGADSIAATANGVTKVHIDIGGDGKAVIAS